MKAVTCPQCGSLISKIAEHQSIVQCDYCGAKVMVAEQKPLPPPPKPEIPISFDEYQPRGNSASPRMAAILITSLIVVVVGILLLVPRKNSSPVTPSKQVAGTGPALSPTVKPEKLSALEFGGKGTSAGLFDNAGEITIDGSGHIYVSDDTRRVQRFDENGKFLNLWNVSGKKDETIEKIAAVGDEIYVLIGGEIVIFNPETGEQKHVLTDSRRHYIDDFVPRDDGGMMYLAENGKREEIVQTKGRAIVNRFDGIHSTAAEKSIPAQGIRLAIDGQGNIYSVFALGDIYGEYNYDDEDLMTFKFSPGGKFINKFAAGLMPKAILTDNQSRVYILNAGTGNNSEIIVFSSAGSEIKRITLEGFQTNAMAIDRQNNIYTISSDQVFKLKPVDFEN